MRISIVTLGCKVNQSESASIEGSLRQAGHEIVTSAETPDVTIINTCTVTAKSDYQSRQMIRRAVKTGSRVIATGCYAQIKPDELSKIQGLDLIVGNSGKTRMLEYLPRLGQNIGGAERAVGPSNYMLTPQPYSSSRSRAFLKIQDGCNLACTYCTVPIARGRSRSLEPQHILSALEKLESDGFMEIVLTGIHIGTYGVDLKPKSSLFELVDKITKKHTRLRFRLSSLEPQEFDDRFIDLINDKLVCPHLHIPLQSGSDRVLKKMRRGYTVSYYLNLIEKISAACPNIAIGSDLIVGFPGETEDDFNRSMKFINDIQLSYLHVFPYSVRPDTPAKFFSDHISSDAIKERAKLMIDMANKKKYRYLSRQIGRQMDVLVENKTITDGYYRAISGNYLRPLVDAELLRPRQRVNVKGVAVHNKELICKPINTHH